MCANTFADVTVVIPSLDPDEKLKKVVDGLLQEGFTQLVLVNDGSDEEHLQNFPDPAAYPQCVILHHEKNRGKGAALKTAFAYIRQHFPQSAGVVTVDGDAQHRPEDVHVCCDEMQRSGHVILGARDFSLPHVPKRSRMGNNITAGVFRLLCGIQITDTQTGLRAIPAAYLEDMLEVEGDRFEYETNMLLIMKKRHIPFHEQRIETVYIEENKTSHFRAVRDSIRIYKLIIKFMLSSLSSCLLDLLLYFLFSLLFQRIGGDQKVIVFVCTALARVLSALFNFYVNKKAVFGNNGSTGKTLARYIALAVPQMCISALCVYLLGVLFRTTAPWASTLLKMVVDTILFFISFRIQNNWVFAEEGKKDKKN